MLTSPTWFLSLGFMPKILYAFLISPVCATCPTHFISLDLVTLVMSTNYKDPHYTIFSTLLLLPLS